jgi:hypothetical protein
MGRLLEPGDFMQQRATTILHQSLQLLHAAVLTLAICLILVPATRATPARVVFFVLWFSIACVATVRLWRRGYLAKSPQQIYESVRGGQRIFTTRLEAVAAGAAIVATFFVSPLHG